METNIEIATNAIDSFRAYSRLFSSSAKRDHTANAMAIAKQPRLNEREEVRY